MEITLAGSVTCGRHPSFVVFRENARSVLHLVLTAVITATAGSVARSVTGGLLNSHGFFFF